jgi:hypothetical protein
MFFYVQKEMRKKKKKKEAVGKQAQLHSERFTFFDHTPLPDYQCGLQYLSSTAGIQQFCTFLPLCTRVIAHNV